MPEDMRRRRPGRRRLNKRGRRKRRLQRIIRSAVMFIPIFAALLFLKNFIGENFVLTDSGIQKDPGSYQVQNTAALQSISDGEVRAKLTELAQSNKTVRQVLEQADQYPADLLELLSNNEETADFVLGYTEKKGQAPAEDIGEVASGEIPLLLQWDERWGYAQYGDNMIAINGCGPTVVAMAAAGLTGDNSITPYKVAQYAEEQGYYTGESGTSWELMTQGAVHFGVQGQELGLSESEILSELESGHPVICSMRPGDFTTTGHFIVLTGVEDGKIRVNDPNSRKRSETLWDYDTLEYQINNLWAFSLI